MRRNTSVNPIILAVAACACMSIVSKSDAQDNKQVVPFIDGMTITTEDAVATIEVRAQSVGPGFCGTRFMTNGDSLEILAPPLSWSDWQELTSHFGSISFKITNTVVCSTGVVAEVRYYPSQN